MLPKLKIINLTCIALIILAVILIAFYIWIPQSASNEYIYTVEKLYQFVAIPCALIGLFGFIDLNSEILGKLALKISSKFYSINPIWVVRISIFLLAISCAIIIWVNSFLFLCYVYLSLLPYLCLVVSIWNIRLRLPDRPFFLSVLYGAFSWSALVWLQINLLSAFNLINGNIISAFWLIVSLPLIYLLLKRRREWSWPVFRGWDWIPVIIAILTLIIAIAYPPNNYDVMAYHMPRVAQWLQNGTLAPYSTPVERQIGMAPFNAYVALQSYAPYRLDYFVNLGQWLAYAGCMFGILQIVVSLGGSKTAQSCALIFAATLPNAIIQASNTESCLIVSFFLCAMAFLFISWMKQERIAPGMAILMGMAIGFAILSKGSAYPIAFPFVIFMGWRCLKDYKKALLSGFLAALIVISINAPHLYRNYTVYGSLVGGSEKNILKHPTPQTFLVNSIYNFVVNHPVLFYFGGKETLQNFSSSIGVDKNNREIFPWGALDNIQNRYVLIEGQAPNPAQSLFLLFVLLAIIFRKFRPPLIYTLPVILAFIFFCLFLIWHMWTARIQTSLLLLAAPVAGIYMAWLDSRRLRAWLLAIFCLISFFPLFLCVERPLIPEYLFQPQENKPSHFLFADRDELLFNTIPEMKKEFINSTLYIVSRNPEVIGVKTGADSLEYPLWRIARNRMKENMPRILSVTDKQENMPRYVLEFVREWGEDYRSSPRALEYKDGKARIVYGEGSKN